MKFELYKIKQRNNYMKKISEDIEQELSLMMKKQMEVKKHFNDEIRKIQFDVDILKNLNSDENFLDTITSNMNMDRPFRLAITEKNGTIIGGKIESGNCRTGDQCIIMPNKKSTKIIKIYYENIEEDSGVCGEKIQLKLMNVKENDISIGFILCDIQYQPCQFGRIFDAEIRIVEHQSIIQTNYISILHIHGIITQVKLKYLKALIDHYSSEIIKTNPTSIQQDDTAIGTFELFESEHVICMEKFQYFPQFGQFTLRNQGRIVAIGKVLEIIQ